MSDARCEGFRELVSAFIDERLEAPELLRLEAHFERCGPCREFEGELRRVRELLVAAEVFRPLRRPPPGFAAAVAARAAGLPTPAVAFPLPAVRPRHRALSWAGLAAAAAAALVIAWSWQRLLPGEAPEQRLAVRPAAQVAAVAGEEGSFDSWMREHATAARGATLLGPAEEVEFVAFRHAGDR